MCGLSPTLEKNNIYREREIVTTCFWVSGTQSMGSGKFNRRIQYTPPPTLQAFDSHSEKYDMCVYVYDAKPIRAFPRR